jgi:cytoplasmic tRNA 2-thiolation protein 1
LIKNLERIRPSAILDVVRSGEDMAKLVPDMPGQACVNEVGKKAVKSEARRKRDVKPDATAADEEEAGGCGSGAGGRSNGGEMAEVEKKLREDEEAEAEGREVEITTATVRGQRHDRDTTSKVEAQPGDNGAEMGRNPSIVSVSASDSTSHTAERAQTRPSQAAPQAPPSRSRKVHRQKLGQCQRCGYISSQDVCKACMLLEGLNKNRPRIELGTEDDGEETGSNMMRQLELVEAVGK